MISPVLSCMSPSRFPFPDFDYPNGMPQEVPTQAGPAVPAPSAPVVDPITIQLPAPDAPIQ